MYAAAKRLTYWRGHYRFALSETHDKPKLKVILTPTCPRRSAQTRKINADVLHLVHSILDIPEMVRH